LQDLSRKLGLQSSGSREELVTRLRLWHISRHEGQAFQGSNFYLLPVKENTVLPQFLSPYKPIENSERRSILRKRVSVTASKADSGVVQFSTPPQSPVRTRRHHKRRSSEEENAQTSPRRSRRHSHNGSKRKKLVQFSPYNRVQLISPRKDGDNQHIKQLYDSIREGQYENSEDEEEEWSRSVSCESSTDNSGGGRSTPELLLDDDPNVESTERE